MLIATGYCYAKIEHDTKDSLCCNTADSVLSEISQMDTVHLACDTTYTVLNEAATSKESTQNNKKVKKCTDKMANASQQKWPGWLDATLDAVGSAFLWLVSPVRPVWGDYAELGQNTTAPLALFKRSSFAQDKADIISKIQSNYDNDFKDIYDKIFIEVIATPKGWGTSGSQAPNAAYAKFGAFVLLMGVDNTGAPLSSTDSTTIATNVLSILNTYFNNTPNSWFEGGE